MRSTSQARLVVCWRTSVAWGVPGPVIGGSYTKLPPLPFGRGRTDPSAELVAELRAIRRAIDSLWMRQIQSAITVADIGNPNVTPFQPSWKQGRDA